jgi:AAA15 family ATPase/GTPase
MLKNARGTAMLKKFSVKNFKSFSDWFTFDLSQINGYEFNTECIHREEQVVKTSIIYGYNSVGKSNLGLAIFDIITHLTDKNRVESKYSSNYKHVEHEEELTEFKYTFQFGEHILHYSYGKTDYLNLTYEKVSIDDECIISYDRRTNTKEVEIKLSGAESLNRNLDQIKISVLKYIKSNTVLAPEITNEILDTFFKYTDRMLLFWSLDDRKYEGYEEGVTSILDSLVDSNHFEDFILMLKESGLETNLVISNDAKTGKDKIFFDYNGKLLDFYSNCSAGMRSLCLFYYWFQKIKFSPDPPSFIFIDEFDAFYHLSLAKRVVELLKATEIQVVLTTHNTSLMTNDLLRPDCYFLMYRDKIQSIAQSTDKDLRLAHNIEKMYKAGAFDA